MVNRSFVLTTPSGSVSDTTLEVDPPASGRFLARAMMPIEPSPSLPSVFLGGREAQVEIATRAPNGDADVVEVICLVNAGTTSIEVENSGTPGGDAVFSPDLSSLGLECKLANVTAPVVANMETGVASVLKDGNWLKETRYWSRFTNGTETFGGVHFYAEQRADQDVIVLTVRVSNAVCHPGAGNPTITDSNDYYTENPTVDGDAYFDYMQLTGLPAGWIVVADVERDSMDLANGYIVKPLEDTNEQHLLPCRNEFVRRLAICHVANQSRAEDLLKGLGKGVMTGANSYYEREAWGTTKCRMPVITDAFEYNSLTGLDAAKAKRQAELDRMDVAYRDGADDSGVGLQVASGGAWHHPTGNADGTVAGGGYIAIHGWPFLVRQDAQVAMRMNDSNLERMAIAVVHPDTGDTVTAHDLAAANQVPGDEGKQPWDIKATSGHRPVFDIVWMVHPDQVDGGVPQSHKQMPTAMAWNSPDSQHTCPYEARVLWQDGDTGGGSVRYRRYDDQHISRYLFTMRAGVWHVNDSCTKDLALSLAGYSQFAQTPYRVADRRSSVSGSILDELDDAAADPNNGHGFARASAWKTEAGLIGHNVGTPAWRAANAVYWDTFGEMLELRSAPITRSTQSKDSGQSNSPDPYVSYGPTDLVNQTGNLDPQYDYAQTFELFFVMHSAFGASKSVYEGADATNAGRMKLVVDGMGASIFDLMETPEGKVYEYAHNTTNRPHKFMVCANNNVPVAPFYPWTFYGGSQGGTFPGKETSTDMYHACSYAFRSTSDRFYLDRAAQGLGFDPAGYTDLAVGENLVSGLGGSVFDSISNETTPLVALFQ